MKKIFAIILTLSIALTFAAGCSGSGGSSAGLAEKNYSLQRAQTDSQEEETDENGIPKISKWASEVKTTKPSQKTTPSTTKKPSDENDADDFYVPDDDGEDSDEFDDDNYFDDDDGDSSSDSGKSDEELFNDGTGALDCDNYAKLRVAPFLKKHKIERQTDFCMVQMEDITGEGLPDLLVSQYSAAGGHGGLSNVYIYDLDSRDFKEIPISDSFFGKGVRLARRKSNDEIFLSNGRPELYNSFNDFYTPAVFGKAVVRNGKLELDKIYDGENDFDSWQDYHDTIESEFEFVSEPELIKLEQTSDGRNFILKMSEDEVADILWDNYWSSDYNNW